MSIVQQGALNTTALTNPGAYIIIVPPPIAVNGVPSNKLGIVGTASWGPVNVPTTIGNPTAYQQSFGPQQNRANDLGTAVAIASLQGASNFCCSRVTDGTDTAASVVVQTNCITIAAKYTGSLGNQATVQIAASPISGKFNVTLGLPAIGYSQTFPNISGSGNAFWAALANAINNGIAGTLIGASPYFTATAGAGTTAPTAATVSLTGGTDGVTTITTAVMIGVDTAPRTGMYSLRKQGCAVAMLADLSDTTSFTTQVAFGLSEGVYMFATMPAATGIPSQSENAQQTALLSAGVSSYELKVMFGDWVYWLDTVNKVTRLVSPQAFAAGRRVALAPNQSLCNKPVFGVIGTQQSGLPGSTQTQTYADADLTLIFGSGSVASFDVITNPIEQGAVWGVNGGFNTSATAGINDDSYTTMTNYLAATLNAVAGKYVGVVITPELFDEATATVSNYCGNLVLAGLLSDVTDASGQTVPPYTITYGPSNNPQSLTGIGYTQMLVQITYQGINKFFLVNLQGGSTVVQP